MSAIKLINVGKKFVLSGQKDKAGMGLLSAFHGQKVFIEFWALKNINMDIDRGKIVGIIGRNGAGKTTLLNILAGISRPSVGEVKMDGKVSSILTLGAGFQDELSGSENIYLNSSILGISRPEISKQYRNIIEFSELEGLLDYPLKTYSQGMRMRLGFSVAVHLGFDILLLDEIFSVGDVSFQKKCFDKIDEFKKEGKTMVITSQSLDLIERICDEAVLLEGGEIIRKGPPSEAIGGYLEVLGKKKFADTFKQRYCVSRWWADKRFWGTSEGSKEAKITAVKIYDSRGKEANRLKPGDSLKVKVDFAVEQEVSEPHFGVAIFREDGVYCYGPNTSLDGYPIKKLNKGEGFFSIEYKSLRLKPGNYRLSAAIWDKNELWAYDYHIGCYKFEITGEKDNGQLLNLKYKWEPGNGWQKLNVFDCGEPKVPFNVTQRWQDKIAAAGIELLSAGLLDSSGGKRGAFGRGEDVKVVLEFKFLKNPGDCFLWVGLFRGDGVYCHGASKKLSGEKASLIYPGMPLLSGEYYLSIGVWSKDKKEPLLYKQRACDFNISCLDEAHGTVHMEHVWDWKLYI